VNLSGNPADEYFADGMTDELITNLAKISALRVSSYTSISQYKTTSKPLPQIARELQVDGIVEGSVLRSGDQIRITAQLIYAPHDQHLWAEEYQRSAQSCWSGTGKSQFGARLPSQRVLGGASTQRAALAAAGAQAHAMACGATLRSC
jgi:hypothetical protein